MPDVLEILKQYLVDNGYDGLYRDECGCFVDDLLPCVENDVGHCQAGYKGKVEFEGEMVDGIVPDKGGCDG